MRFWPCTIEALEHRTLLAGGEAYLDPTFGEGGIVQTDFGLADEAYDVLVQRDGRILVVGNFQTSGEFNERGGHYDNEIALARYLPDGALDATFGEGGLVRITGLISDDFSPRIAEMAELPDGGIVMVGNVDLYTLLIRIDADGSDPLVKRLHADSAAGLFAPRRTSLEVQPDGKIILSATAALNDFMLSGSDFLIARFTADLERDPAFGRGREFVTAGYFAKGLGVRWTREIMGHSFVQPDGKILVVGASVVRDKMDSVTKSWHVSVLRLNANGTRDRSFGGGDGKLVVPNRRPPRRRPYPRFGDIPLTRLPDGDIAFTSARRLKGGRTAFLIGRLNPDGTLDTSFGGDGYVRTVPAPLPANVVEDPIRDLFAQADGKIVAYAPSVGLVRYNADGSKDRTFGNRGVLPFFTAHRFVPDARGNLIAVGGTTNYFFEYEVELDFCVTRIRNPDLLHEVDSREAIESMVFDCLD